MKKYIILLLIQLSVIFAFSQKTYKKLDKYFNESKYDKCIESAKKYFEKDSKNYILPLFISKSYFELYSIEKPETKKKNLKNSLKYAYKIKKADKNVKFVKEYDAFLKLLYKATVKYSDSLFNSENKDKAETYYSYIAKVYNDTLYGYLHFYPPKNIKKNVGLNNKKVNQTDAAGLKQGFWTKKYPNGVLAYEVYFKDNKPVGDYKRYHENGKLYAFLVYDEKSEWADAKLYSENGKLIAEGTYHGKLKAKQWVFYSEKGYKLKEETYNEGKKNGVSKTFYKNGNVSEEQNWENDIENGIWRQYFENKKVRLEMRIDNGKRNSAYYKYYPSGKFEIKGRYKNDLMEGTWSYYDLKGNVVKEVEYVKGKAQNQDELDAKEQEIFNKLEENRHRLLDPANFINEPMKYMKQSGK